MLSLSKKNVVTTLAGTAGVSAVVSLSAMGLEHWNRKKGNRVGPAKRVAQAFALVCVLSVACLVTVIFAWDDSAAARAEESFRSEGMRHSGGVAVRADGVADSTQVENFNLNFLKRVAKKFKRK